MRVIRPEQAGNASTPEPMNQITAPLPWNRPTNSIKADRRSRMFVNTQFDLDRADSWDGLMGQPGLSGS